MNQIINQKIDFKNEIVAGITTFLTMLYIAFVNPSILSVAGLDPQVIFVTTCLIAGIGSIAMGLIARIPIAVAPAMGLNAYFAFVVVGGLGYSWQVAMGAVVISAFFLFIITVLKIRIWLMSSIPETLKIGIAAGIGFFITFIGLTNSKIIVGNPATLVALGDIKNPQVLLALFSLLIIVISAYKKWNSGIFLSVAITAIIALVLGYTKFNGIMSFPVNIFPTISQIDVKSAFTVAMSGIIFSFFLINLFDSSGTLLTSMENAKIDYKKDNTLQKSFLVDSSSSVAGCLLGTSSVTAYIESNSGIVAGGKTGLVSITVGVLFLLMIFFSPLTSLITSYTTAGALIYVGILMSSSLRRVNWEDLSDSVPAFLIVIMTVFTYSITDGIAFGFISYVLIKTVLGRWKEVHVSVFVIALLFLIHFIFTRH